MITSDAGRAVGPVPAETVTPTYDNAGYVTGLAGTDTYLAAADYYWHGAVKQRLLGSGGERVRLDAAIDEATDRPAGMPSVRARRAPARPARATAIAVNAARSGGLYRECGVVRPGICSTNVTRPHPASRHASRRTNRRITTGRPANTVSATLR
jgi:hypothetical protein